MSGSGRLGSLALMGLLLLLLLLLPGRALAGEPVPRFEPAPCPVPAPEDVECGYLVVPEDRADPDSRTIRLAIAVLPARSDAPAPDPVVYLEGGPGGSALEGLDHWLDSPIRKRRDLILFEQRGTRYAQPNLDCPELKDAYLESWERDLSDREAVALEIEAAIACRDRLRAEGVNLAAYHSAASAADLADLRRVLGYDRWNLYGISYGTRLALTVMRDQPQGVRSVVLDSVDPPPLDTLVELAPYTARVIEHLLAGCAADADCRAAYPHLEEDLYRLLERANARPLQIAVRHPESGEMLHLPVDGDTLVAHLFLAFYDSDLIPYLPLLITELEGGRDEMLLPLTSMLLDTILSGSEGMNNSVQCYEEIPFNPLDEIEAAAAQVNPLLVAYTMTDTVAICELWGAGRAGPIEDAPVHSDIPTLVLEGEYDPITPPEAGRLAAETLSRHFYYQFPGLGHGTTLAACPMSITLAFLDDPTVAPDAACLEEMTEPDFRTPDDLYISPAASRLFLELNREGSPLPWQIAAWVASLGLLLVLVVLWAVLRLLGVWPCPHPWFDGLFHGLLALIATLYILFVAGYAGLIMGAVLDDWSLLIFGLPRIAPPVLGLAWLATGLTFLWLALLAVGWLRRTWPLWRRALYLLLALIPLAFWGILLI